MGLSWLIDKSAIAKLPASEDRHVWVERMNRGLVHVAVPTWLEMAWSARSVQDWRQKKTLLDGLVYELLSPTAELLARDLADALVATAHHRGPSAPDILVAAVATDRGHTVLHDDHDFETLAGILPGLAVERLA